MEIRTDFGFSSEELSTEKISNLDPDQPNPHLQRWFLDRRVEPVGWMRVSQRNGQWGVQLHGIESIQKGYLRKNERWYHSFQKFPCVAQSNDFFQTLTGAKKAISRANEFWIETLKEAEIQWRILFTRISEKTSVAALQKGALLFSVGLDRATERWRTEKLPQVRNEEWDSYLKDSQVTHLCAQKAQLRTQEPLFRFWMDPWDESLLSSEKKSLSLSEIAYKHEPLAQIPVRLWNGFFVVSGEFSVQGKIWKGNFLVDLSSNFSLLSPSGLIRLGIYPEDILIPHAPARRLVWSRLVGPKERFVPQSWIDAVKIGSWALPLQKWGLVDTEVRSFEESSSCCEGVLGADFLKQAPIEFQVGPHPVLRIWAKQNFHPSGKMSWVQVSLQQEENWVSQCQMVFPELKLSLNGVRWDMSSRQLLKIHTHRGSDLALFRGRTWNLICDGDVRVAQGVFPGTPEKKVGFQWKPQFPAVTLGMPFLTQRRFILDLPHGRIWGLELDPSATPLSQSLSQ